MMVWDKRVRSMQRHQLLSIHERLIILSAPERQFTPIFVSKPSNKVMPKSGIVDFQKDREFKVGGWTEI